MSLRILMNVAFGLSRVGFGVAAAAVPARVGATWVGEDADRISNRTVFRAMGFRDIAVGAGVVEAALRDQAGPWLAVSLLADLGDLGATLISSPHLDRRNVAITAALTGSATLAAATLLVIDRSCD